jgi:2-oxoglutarate dehydrogenase E2 component (dihydrolipoamide succinyltransferase)
MDPLFDQDSDEGSGASGDGPPIQGAGPTTADESEPELLEGQVPEHPEGPEAVSSAIGVGDEVAGSDAGNGVGPRAGEVDADRVEPRAEPISSDEAEPGPPDRAAAATEAPATVEPESAAAPTDDITSAPGWSLGPPPKVESARDRAATPPEASAPADAEPAAPPPALPLPPMPAATEAADAVPPAPSSAGPAPSPIEARRPSAGFGHRLAHRIRLWVRLPTPVRATSDQGAYSLVMLFVLAVTVGVVGAGLLVGLGFLIISLLGHGSGG